MKIDAAVGSQEAWSTHLWAVDTVIPHVTLHRRGHGRTVAALVSLGQPGERWSLCSAFAGRHDAKPKMLAAASTGHTAYCSSQASLPVSNIRVILYSAQIIIYFDTNLNSTKVFVKCKNVNK